MRTVALLVLLVCLAPAGAEAASSGSFDDPIGDSLEFAPDLGATTVSVGDDDTLTVDTRIVPRPPANWGGCAYYVGLPPFQTCVPADMTVTWYFDYASAAGSLADGGADAKVTVIPSRGQTFWESARWDAANGKFSAGATPAGTEDPGGIRWVLRLGDLGVPKPASLRVWAVSLYKSYTGVGTLLSYTDTAGPGTISIAGPASATAGDTSRPCKRAINKANRLQRKIRRTRARAADGAPGAGARLRKLRKQRKRVLGSMQRKCAAPVDQPGPPPASAPPGCRLVTKSVLQQEGAGIFAPWTIKPEVVVECD